MQEITYTALLGNVDKSILHINLGDGFSIEEWTMESFVDFYEQTYSAAEHDIWFKFDSDWGYGHGSIYRPKYVYVVTKELESFPPCNHGKDIDKWMKSLRERGEFESKVSNSLEDKVTKLRLYSEGSIKVCVEIFSSKDGDNVEMESGREELLHCENRPYKVRKSDIAKINTLLNTPPLHTRHKYIYFALENFAQSYRVAHIELEFITLMIALEALFNDGKQELRNKVSRGCAVLLGKSKPSSRKIFKDIKGLYDKRSELVHTGDKSKIENSDLLLLKNYLRTSLLRVVELDLPKQELSMQLSENGFGAYKKIG